MPPLETPRDIHAGLDYDKKELLTFREIERLEIPQHEAVRDRAHELGELYMSEDIMDRTILFPNASASPDQKKERICRTDWFEDENQRSGDRRTFFRLVRSEDKDRADEYYIQIRSTEPNPLDSQSEPLIRERTIAGIDVPAIHTRAGIGTRPGHYRGVVIYVPAQDRKGNTTFVTQTAASYGDRLQKVIETLDLIEAGLKAKAEALTQAEAQQVAGHAGNLAVAGMHEVRPEAE